MFQVQNHVSQSKKFYKREGLDEVGFSVLASRPPARQIGG